MMRFRKALDQAVPRPPFIGVSNFCCCFAKQKIYLSLVIGGPETQLLGGRNGSVLCIECESRISKSAVVHK